MSGDISKDVLHVNAGSWRVLPGKARLGLVSRVLAALGGSLGGLGLLFALLVVGLSRVLRGRGCVLVLRAGSEVVDGADSVLGVDRARGLLFLLLGLLRLGCFEELLEQLADFAIQNLMGQEWVSKESKYVC